MTHPPYLLPWVRVLFLLRSITSTTWGHEARPVVKPLLRLRQRVLVVAVSVD